MMHPPPRYPSPQVTAMPLQPHPSPPALEVQPPGGVSSAAQVTDLMALVAEVRPDLVEALQGIAGWGLFAVPASDGVGLAVLRREAVEELVATEPWVAELEDHQYSVSEGPGVAAAGDERPVVSAALADESRWPVLGREASRLEVGSALAVPLVADGVVVGSATFYARTADAFGPDAVTAGQAYAAAAAVAIGRARQVSHAQLIADQLAAAIDEQRTVRRALGLLIAQDGVDAERAMSVLRALAAERSTDLDGAAQIVWSARVHQGLALTTPAWR